MLFTQKELSLISVAISNHVLELQKWLKNPSFTQDVTHASVVADFKKQATELNKILDKVEDLITNP